MLISYPPSFTGYILTSYALLQQIHIFYIASACWSHTSLSLRIVSILLRPFLKPLEMMLLSFLSHHCTLNIFISVILTTVQKISKYGLWDHFRGSARSEVWSQQILCLFPRRYSIFLSFSQECRLEFSKDYMVSDIKIYCMQKLMRIWLFCLNQTLKIFAKPMTLVRLMIFIWEYKVVFYKNMWVNM